MSYGYVVRLSDGKPLIFGERARGTKVDRLASVEGNEFVPEIDARAGDLAEAMKPKPPAREPRLADVLDAIGAAASLADLKARVAALR